MSMLVLPAHAYARRRLTKSCKEVGCGEPCFGARSQCKYHSEVPNRCLECNGEGCGSCNGKGVTDTCPQCSGVGKLEAYSFTKHPAFAACPTCDGSGKLHSKWELMVYQSTSDIKVRDSLKLDFEKNRAKGRCTIWVDRARTCHMHHQGRKCNEPVYLGRQCFLCFA